MRLALLVITILLGLGSRWFAEHLPALVAQYAGDVLWASMIFWSGRLFFRDAGTWRLAAGSFAVCVAVELSQLYRVPWINALRSSTMGALVLGQGFLWSDLACYALGVVLAAFIDRRLFPSDRRPGESGRPTTPSTTRSSLSHMDKAAMCVPDLRHAYTYARTSRR